MASEGALFLDSAQIPGLGMGIVGTGTKLQSTCCDADVAYRLLVALEGLEIGKILIPELDDPKLISSDQSLTRSPLVYTPWL